MSKRTRRTVIAGGLALALGAASCGGGGDGSGLTGTISISGSSTVEPISSLVAELFNETNPDVVISVDGPGTGDGFELFCKGEIDVSDASRPIAQDEIDACEKGGIDFVELEVAFDGITVMAHPGTDVSCLNTGDLYALFGPESAGVDTWAAADALAAEVDGTGGFPDAALQITAPGEESGTYDAFIELAGIAGTAESRGLPEGETGALRADYQSSANDNVIIQAIEGSPGSLGFVGFAFAEEAGTSVTEIEIDAGDGCVAPSAETIADGSYPLSRSLYIYVNTGVAATNDALRSFVDYYLTEDGLGLAVEEAGYVPLPPERAEATAAAWEAAA